MTVPEAPPLRGAAVSLRALEPSDAAVLQRIRRAPEVWSRWGDVEPEFPYEDDACARWAVVLDGEVVGMVQAYEEPDEMYRHAGVDVFLDPAVHGRGVGRDVVGTVARWLVEVRGHHRLVVDPAADNAAAIACYAAVGFAPVGVLREYERGPDGTWHDGLLMEVLAGELR